jgi:hypothetical protein
MFPIAEIDDTTLAFPANVLGIMPKYEDIPAKYRHGQEPTNRLFNDWFFARLSAVELNPRDGVDKDKAIRHIRAIMGSYEPKHAHKEAAVAFLLDEWFTDIKWGRKG